MSADLQLYQMFIVEMEKAKNSWAEIAPKLFDNPTPDQKKDFYKKIFMSAHNLKAASQMCQLPSLGTFFHKIEDMISGFSRGRLDSDQGIPEMINLGQSLLQRWFLHVKLKTVPAPDCSELYAGIEALIALRSKSTDTTAPDERSKPRAQIPSEGRNEAKKTSKTALEKHQQNDKILVGSAGLDEMINLIGGISVNFEILRHQLHEDHSLSARTESSLHSINQTILWLKETCLQIRMQPAQSLLDNLERTATEVSTKLQKLVTVNRVGDDVLLDKSVLAGLFDILLHVVRNAVDHGVESFQTRQDRGKEMIATLTFSVADIGGNAVIQISDDGSGIDPERVLRKAIEKGLVSEDADLTKEQIIELIFTPEFSTAKEVTAFSGRGVGMDIVRSAIQAMGGSVHVTSDVGKGTTFKIVVPTQMSLIEAFVVSINQRRYAVPKQDLIEIIDIAAGSISMEGSDKSLVVRVGNRLTPAISLRRWFGETEPLEKLARPGARADDSVALIVWKDQLPFAFLVDEVRGLQQVFVRPVPENMSSLPAVSGAAVFSDGEPGLILNLPILLNSAQGVA